jgi:hypothetical protein
MRIIGKKTMHWLARPYTEGSLAQQKNIADEGNKRPR